MQILLPLHCDCAVLTSRSSLSTIPLQIQRAEEFIGILDGMLTSLPPQYALAAFKTAQAKGEAVPQHISDALHASRRRASKAEQRKESARARGLTSEGDDDDNDSDDDAVIAGRAVGAGKMAGSATSTTAGAGARAMDYRRVLQRPQAPAASTRSAALRRKHVLGRHMPDKHPDANVAPPATTGKAKRHAAGARGRAAGSERRSRRGASKPPLRRGGTARTSASSTSTSTSVASDGGRSQMPTRRGGVGGDGGGGDVSRYGRRGVGESDTQSVGSNSASQSRCCETATAHCARFDLPLTDTHTQT